jgi:hypothetical protein
MILEEHFDLATMLLIRHAVKKEDDLDAKSCTYCQEGRDEDLVRIAICSGVRDDGTDRLDADNEINRSHTVVMCGWNKFVRRVHCDDEETYTAP